MNCVPDIFVTVKPGFNFPKTLLTAFRLSFCLNFYMGRYTNHLLGIHISVLCSAQNFERHGCEVLRKDDFFLAIDTLSCKYLL